MLHGKTKAWIDSRLRNVVALVVPDRRCGRCSAPRCMSRRGAAAESEIRGRRRAGLRPAAGGDLRPGDQHRALIQHELLGHNEGSVTFAPKVKRFLAQHYPGYEVRLWGDPKGQDRGQGGERTSYEIFAANGLKVTPAPNLKQNDIDTGCRRWPRSLAKSTTATRASCCRRCAGR
jgi:hypothetical protein